METEATKLKDEVYSEITKRGYDLSDDYVITLGGVNEVLIRKPDDYYWLSPYMVVKKENNRWGITIKVYIGKYRYYKTFGNALKFATGLGITMRTNQYKTKKSKSSFEFRALRKGAYYASGERIAKITKALTGEDALLYFTIYKYKNDPYVTVHVGIGHHAFDLDLLMNFHAVIKSPPFVTITVHENEEFARLFKALSDDLGLIKWDKTVTPRNIATFLINVLETYIKEKKEGDAQSPKEDEARVSCLGCGADLGAVNELQRLLDSDTGHKTDCAWNYYITCPSCQYQSNLGKYVKWEQWAVAYCRENGIHPACRCFDL